MYFLSHLWLNDTQLVFFLLFFTPFFLLNIHARPSSPLTLCQLLLVLEMCPQTDRLINDQRMCIVILGILF